MKYRVVNRKKLFALTIIDTIGLFLSRSFTRRRRKRCVKTTEIKKILIIRLAYIGDVIMTTPALPCLRKMYPDAKIFFLTGEREKELLKGNPNIDRILNFNAFWFYPSSLLRSIGDILRIMREIRAERFDLAIDFRGDIRNILYILFPGCATHRVSYGAAGGGYLLTKVIHFQKIKHRILYHLDIVKALGSDTGFRMPEIFLSQEEENYRKRIFLENRISEDDIVVGIHPGGRKKLKRWEATKYGETARRLITDFSAKIIITGTSEESSLSRKIKAFSPERIISFCGMTTLRELCSIISGIDLFICGDCGPMHIACTLGTAVVCIFGPSKSNETGPYGGSFQLIEKEFPCRFRCDESVCNFKVYHGCMKAITVDDVYSAVSKLLKVRLSRKPSESSLPSPLRL